MHDCIRIREAGATPPLPPTLRYIPPTSAPIKRYLASRYLWLYCGVDENRDNAQSEADDKINSTNQYNEQSYQSHNPYKPVQCEAFC